MPTPDDPVGVWGTTADARSSAPSTIPSTGNPILDALLTRCVEVHVAKGRDYAIGSSDRLATFNNGSRMLEVRPAQVLGVYLWKHISAVFSYIKTGGQSESEPIRERIVDCINYLLLLGLMVLPQSDKDGSIQYKKTSDDVDISFSAPYSSCDHGLTFDPLAAPSCSPSEVRRRWPRLHGRCPAGCGFDGIAYVSGAHMAAGSW